MLLPAGAEEGVHLVCDYSLHETETRPAQVGDRLTTLMFNSGHKGILCPRKQIRRGGPTSWDRVVLR